jgi:peptidoglycan hydrolase CwlO-like protein
MRRVSVSLLAFVVSLAASACVNPRAEANTAQALNDAANQINNLQDDLANLQVQIDSLRTAMVKQDTLIDRLVAVTNIPR